MRDYNFLRVAPALCALALPALLAGCVEELGPVDDVGMATSIPAEVQAAFDNSCATPNCHLGASAAAGLNLEAGASSGILSATASTGLPMVTLGNVGNSYLAIKCLPSDNLGLYGASRTGSKMPLGGNADSDRDVAVIVGWISGALPPEVSSLEVDAVPPFAADPAAPGSDGDTGPLE